MQPAEAVADLTMDDPYLREFHREWLAVRAPGWRLARVLVPAFALAAMAVAAWAWLGSDGRFFYLAGGLGAVAVVEGLGLHRRKRAWLAHCRTLPWHGRTLRIEVRDGDLVQVHDLPGDPRFRRTGAVVVTPHGYLVRYVAQQPTAVPDRAISRVDASVYLPHRALRPAMTRAEFLGRLGGVG